MSGVGNEWDGIDDGFRSPDDDIEHQEAPFNDGGSTVPDPEDTIDPIDAVMRLCVRIDPRNPLHEKIYLWASRLPTDKRGLANIGAHIVQALNRYLDDTARPVSESVYARSVGPARFSELARPPAEPSSYRGAAADRVRYRESLRARQEKLSSEGISSQESHVKDGITSPDGLSSSEQSASNGSSGVEHVPSNKDSKGGVDYAFLSPDGFDEKKSEW